MATLSRRVDDLERTSKPMRFAEWTTRDICGYLANLPPDRLKMELTALSDTELDETIAEIRRYVPGYGEADAHS